MYSTKAASPYSKQKFMLLLYVIFMWPIYKQGNADGNLTSQCRGPILDWYEVSHHAEPVGLQYKRR